MKYPQIDIYIDRIKSNVVKANEMLESQGKTLTVVTKLLINNHDVMKMLEENGIKRIAESRIDTLKDFQDFNFEKWLIRIPMLCEVDDVVKYADVSLNSEIAVIEALNEAAVKQNKKHKVIIMYELGDLREGCMKDEIDDVIEKTLQMSNIELAGIGVNLSCYGEIVPDEKNMNELSQVANHIEEKFNIKLEYVSGGNSSSYKMVSEEKIPSNINNFRFGESVFLGRLPCFEEDILELYQDNFILKTQIVELKSKPSVPWGQRGVSNSFGEDVVFEDKGIMKRAIVALGKEDIYVNTLTPLDSKIVILDASSDHTIIDVTHSDKDYKVGDVIEFKMTYPGVLQAMNSKFITRNIVTGI